MAHTLNRFQVELVRVASYWADRGCHETVKNGGNCIDELQRLYGRPVRESYCTKLVYVIVQLAAEALGMKNPLPKTATACELLRGSVSRGLRVDKTPGIGSPFYRSNAIASSTGHTGIVIDVTSDSIRTVEGNASDRIDDWRYPLMKVKQHKKLKCQNGPGWDFIHIEDLGGRATENVGATLLATSGPSFGAIVLSISVLAGAFFATKSLSN